MKPSRKTVRSVIVLAILALVAAVASGAPCKITRQRAAAAALQQERPALPPTAYSDLLKCAGSSLEKLVLRAKVIFQDPIDLTEKKESDLCGLREDFELYEPLLTPKMSIQSLTTATFGMFCSHIRWVSLIQPQVARWLVSRKAQDADDFKFDFLRYD